ncbi:MAG: phosphoribosylanthranilate isomerase [Spirochaetaceae bacterium]|jgi:phosphoribosylanthranilate isomerase|nr:phosphoribosylanthranilate isomerase [Spirochaetaceae bacterium]
MKIKICGLFREEDIGFANEAGPDYIGFVFAKSRRQVSPEQAARLRSRLREGIVPVGVFVNAPVEEIATLYRDGLIDIAQLHGSEDAAYIRRLKTHPAAGSRPAIPVIKTLVVENRDPHLPPDLPADYILLDSGAGSGTPFDWTLLTASPRISSLLTPHYLPCFLAGGIDRYTIEKAMSFRPYGIDLSSGAETGGLKDREKMIDLVGKLRKGEP